MKNIAGINTQSGPQRATGAIATRNSHPAALKAGLQTTPDDWVEGPGGMMSLADMLKQAGYGEELEEWRPPPPSSPAPHNYEAPPGPPSP
eukprot:9119275-Karenia_brevis.AAC.1